MRRSGAEPVRLIAQPAAVATIALGKRGSDAALPAPSKGASPRLAAGRRVIVSRGELIEIGGGFRVPDVLARSGARMVEVGTTNKTRVGDYRRAIDEAPAEVAAIPLAQQ